MNDSNDRDPIDLMADSFVSRLRAGERPSISEYVQRYPHLAVRELLPALVELEQNASADSMASDLSSHVAEAPPHQLGEYTIVREIGRGGMGVVYEAVQEPLGRHVALKVLPVDCVGGARLERFRREAKAAARLHHSNIVPVYGIAEHQGAHYYAMQFIQGQSLNLVIDELKRLKKEAARPPVIVDSAHTPRASDSDSNYHIGTRVEDSTVGDRCSFSPSVTSELTSLASTDQFYRSVARVGLQVAEALAYAHSQGILHRDIKPSNLLLDGRGTVWVTDFGLAKFDGLDDLTESGDVVGTLQYMAPERLDGRSDPRSDVYGLGATLYELVALEPLYVAHGRVKLIERLLYEEPLALRRRDPRVPRDLETIIEKALVKEPSERYESAEQMADDLRLFLADRTIRARRTTAAERFWRWRRRNPALAAVTAALLLVFALGFAGVAWKWRDAEFARDQADRRAEEIRLGHQRLIAAGSLVDSGTHFTEMDAWDVALAAYSRAIELRPELASGWQKRGDLYARLGLFELAAADMQRAFELHEPVFDGQWFCLAILRLHIGDLEGYRRVCDRMTTSVFGTSDMRAAISLVRTCLLTREPIGDVRRLVKLAERAVAHDPNDPFYRHAVAIAYYRAGKYDEALACCQKAGENGEILLPIVAMAYERLGKADLAHAAFSAAAQLRERWMQQLTSSMADHWAIHQGATARWPIDPVDWLEFAVHFCEAAELLKMPAPAADARQHVFRGRAHARLRQRDLADVEYRRALELQPGDPEIRYEAYRNRGHHLIKLERFAEAADEFARAVEFAPSDCNLWSFVATAQFAAGSADAYRKTCAEMIDRFARDANDRDAFILAWTCTLLPDAVPDLQVLAPIAETGAQWWFDSERGLLATYYRLGRYQDAIQSFDRLTEVARPMPSALLFAAMAHQQLGQHETARQKLAEAADAMADPLERAITPMPDPAIYMRSWQDKVSERLLRKEAEALILGRSS